jgi:hypothetical protein
VILGKEEKPVASLWFGRAKATPRSRAAGRPALSEKWFVTEIPSRGGPSSKPKNQAYAHTDNSRGTGSCRIRKSLASLAMFICAHKDQALVSCVNCLSSSFLFPMISQKNKWASFDEQLLALSPLESNKKIREILRWIQRVIGSDPERKISGVWKTVTVLRRRGGGGLI